MPDKPATVAAYAAGASLAAITLFYVFGPTFFIDNENAYGGRDNRKKVIVGLHNPANDCFINSVLQALAGLGDLRLYLIRELHRRKLDGPEVYASLPDPTELKKTDKPEKIRDLQQGYVTEGLKEMLDALNERPLHKKTISARPFVEVLEKAFRTRISRNQQDAQEFLQVVAERLCDEYHAGVKARKRFKGSPLDVVIDSVDEKLHLRGGEISNARQLGIETGLNGMTDFEKQTSVIIQQDEGFPFEGKIESQIRCTHCNFKYKPNVTNFVTLTLNVPQKSATTLDNCFDILLKTEDIDDFRCDRCRLVHAVEWKADQYGKSSSEDEQRKLDADIDLLKEALEKDPEVPPKDVELPKSELVPQRKIKKYMRITTFPKMIAIHLSRSVFDSRTYTSKNMAKVAFAERLRLGGLLDERWYRILGIVCHKGGHNSGHYESFRRNHIYPPFATPDVFSAYAAQTSRANSIAPSRNPSPQIRASIDLADSPITPSSIAQTPTISSTSLSPPNSRPVSGTSRAAGEDSLRSDPKPSSRPQSRRSDIITKFAGSRPATTDSNATAKFRRKKKVNDRWWRISDDKIKECKTAEVLAMQKEVYLLFYELERPGDEA